MSLRARLAGAEFAFLSRLGATRRTPNRERRFFLGFHEYIMVRRPGTRWSILTNKIEKLILEVVISPPARRPDSQAGLELT
jgi:hypothetical protein